MAEMTEDEQLKEVKNSLGVTGNYQDARLLGYLREIKQYLTDAGVPKENLSSSAVMGVLSRGVNDLLYSGELSAYFKERVIQLSY